MAKGASPADKPSNALDNTCVTVLAIGWIVVIIALPMLDKIGIKVDIKLETEDIKLLKTGAIILIKLPIA